MVNNYAHVLYDPNRRAVSREDVWMLNTLWTRGHFKWVTRWLMLDITVVAITQSLKRGFFITLMATLRPSLNHHTSEYTEY